MTTYKPQFHTGGYVGTDAVRWSPETGYVIPRRTAEKYTYLLHAIAKGVDMTDRWAVAAAVYEAGGALPPVPAPPYIYNATVIHFHDGDTGTFSIDLGFDVAFTTNIRLVGCNAYELAFTAPDGSKPGMAARDNINALLPAGTQVVISSDKVDKFGGRYDSSITYLVADGTAHDLVADLIAQQWAAPWTGAGKAPTPPWPRTVTP